MVLCAVAVNCQKQVIDFLEGPINLIKMHLSLISYKFHFLSVTHTCNYFGETL